jgi:LCP family protein required for cell wall assembly
MNELKKHWQVYLLISMAVVVLVVAVGYGLSSQLYKNFVTERVVVDHSIIAPPDDTDDEDELPKAFEDRTLNILLLATDEDGYRTDSMMLIHYDQLTRTTSLFSIPRDYRVAVSPELKELINYRRDHIKFTEFHAYALAAKYPSPASLTAQAIEEFLNVEIDHFVLMNFKGFRQVIDSVGGVEIYIPQDMKYDDPTQNLHIDLKQGLQHLDGKKAEHAARFRQDNSHIGYGDFGRMEMQQYILTAYVKKLFSASSLLNMGKIYTSLTDFVTTDATLEDTLGILKVVMDADLNRIYSHTLPGEDRRIEGIYYYDPPIRRELIAFVEKALSKDKTTLLESESYSLKILNGSNRRGVAEAYKVTLEEAGYTVHAIGTHNGTRTLKTQIIVPKEGIGHDLKPYFALSEVLVDPTKFNDEEQNTIIVIVGALQ